MKKALLLFAQVSVRAGLADPAALTRLVNEQDVGLEAEWAYLEDLLYYVDNDRLELVNTQSGTKIEDYNVVYFRYWGQAQGHAIAAANICRIKGVPFIDTEVYRVGSQNKITQYINLHETKVAIPRTLVGLGGVLSKHYKEYEFDFPFIMKSKGGTRGQSNFLVKSKEQLDKIIADDPEDTFILQEFLPNDGDYRVVVFGDEVKLIIERLAVEGSHLNNTSQGGSARIVPLDTLPESVHYDCVRAAKFYGRQIAGVDIVQSNTDGKYYCFEVNRAPQIEHASFEKEKAKLLAEFLATY